LELRVSDQAVLVWASVRHTVSVPELVTALLIAILFAAPWIGAIALVCWRAGARLLWSEADEAFPTQSSQWRGASVR
jgi:hypothetical protein